MPVEVWTYTGRPPSNGELEEQLGLGRDRLWLTATPSQADARVEMAGDCQRDPEGTASIYFPAAMRHLIQRPTLSRTDLRILVSRFAQNLTNPRAVMQIRHDAGVLGEALADIWGRGCRVEDLNTDAFASAELRVQLLTIERWLQGNETFASRPPFELAVHELVSTGLPLAPTVIFEGFTFLTPLQRFLLDQHKDSRVVVIVPYSEAQSRAFAAIEHTYTDWWEDRAQLQTAPFPSTPLGTLQTTFDAAPVAPEVAVGVQIRAFDHPHEEAASAIRAVAEALAQGAGPSEIAIVVPNRGRHDHLLLEEAQRQNLPVRIQVPPRLLLLTPVGRFALTLYEFWDDGDVVIDADQFHTVLASGWLGAAAQVTARNFRSVADEWFRRCTKPEEWQASLTELRHLDRTSMSNRLPSHWIEDSDLDTWGDAIELLEAITTRLFQTEARPIGAHVQALLGELEGLRSPEQFETEREVIERIREALAVAADASSLHVDAEEFGEVLVALAREYESAAGDLEGQGDGTVWVTTPNGIDGARRGVVITLGLDAASLPRKFDPGWPLTTGDLGRHLEIERYLFTALLRSAIVELRLSYATRRDGEPVGPSPYLRMLHTTEEASPEPVGGASFESLDDQQVRVAARDVYELTELAIYGLCPYRYRAEHLEPRSGVYTDEFHLRLLAQADWLDSAFGAVSGRPQTFRAADFRASLFEAGRQVAAEVRSCYPGLSDASWRNVRQYVGEALRFAGEQANDGFALAVELVKSQTYEFVVDDRVVRVGTGNHYAVRSGIHLYPQINPLRSRTFGFPLQRPDGVRALDDAGLFVDPADAQYLQRDAIVAKVAAGDWSATRTSVAETLRALVRRVETQGFPRRPGEHCQHCPVRDPCLGLEAS